jgi:peptide/nickel transport system substrate-binding protein
MLPDPTGARHGWTREAALILRTQRFIRLCAMARRCALALCVALASAPAWAGPPLEPSVATMETIGQRGGDLNMLAASSQDTRLLVVYGYARLVGYDLDLNLVPDILSEVEVEDGRVFTLRLREGHRWSDGAPFTSEDFRYWWEDVANNEKLSPFGPPQELEVDGELPKVEILDPLTVRYSWSSPNPFFLPALAGARPLFIYLPAHYLSQFHEAYADPAELAREVEKDQARDWAQLHGRRERMYRFDNPDLPTLQPWMLRTRPPAVRFIAERNPYFHRVDAEGQQLPYIDRVILDVVDGKLIPVKAGAGETDLQSRGLVFSDYTFLKSSEAHSHLDTRLWRSGRGAHLALYPNLNTEDEVWRELFRDVRFRRALSLGINREDINKTFYFDLALTGNNSVLPESPLYEPAYRYDWAIYDPAEADRLLDEIGLTRRDSRGVRLLPDGRPMDLIIESAGQGTEESDVLELIEEAWLEIGIKIYTKPLQREVLRNRIFAGSTLMTMWFGLENGIPSAEMSPWEFAPTSQQQYQWPKWGQYFETGGEVGEAPDLPAAKELLALYDAWRLATSIEEQRRIWQEMLEINADQVFSIGVIAGVPQPIAVRDGLNNVPQEAIYNWDPGAQLGIYRPDTFWFTPPGTERATR